MKVNDILEESRGVTKVGIRFSHKPDLQYFDGSKHGGGISGAERKRAQHYPDSYIRERVYFYNEDEFTRKEPGLGIYAYKARLTNLYDFKLDPDRLKARARAKAEEDNHGYPDPLLAGNYVEQMIKDAGYSGYFQNDIIIVFGDVRKIERTEEY
jgi:hypothetical protein